MKIVLRIISALVVAGTLSAQSIQFSNDLNLFYSGSAGIESWYFPRKAPVKLYPEYVNTVKGNLDLSLQFASPFEITFIQRFQIDTEDKDRNRYEIDDLYLDYFSENYEIRAGLQRFSWKTVESISHADFLNQTDLESDFLDADKLSELALRLRYMPASDIDQVFEFYYIPYMRATRFPVGDNRFSFGLNIKNDTGDHLFQDSAKEWRPQFALSYQRPFFESVDTRLFYFNGYNRFPGLNPNQMFTEFFHQYHLVQKAGLTFQGQINAWLVKGEMVYTNYQKSVINQLNEIITPAYFAYTVGFEYTIYSMIIENHDVGTIFEIIGDSDSGKKPEQLESFRPFQNHLFGGFRYAFNNVSDRSLLAGGFYNYKDGDLILNVEYSERLMDVFTLKLEYMDITSDTEPIKKFEHTDRFIIELLYNF